METQSKACKPSFPLSNTIDTHREFRNTLKSMIQHHLRVQTPLSFHDLAVSIKRIGEPRISRKAKSAKCNSDAQSLSTGILLSFGRKSKQLLLMLASLGAHARFLRRLRRWIQRPLHVSLSKLSADGSIVRRRVEAFLNGLPRY